MGRAENLRRRRLSFLRRRRAEPGAMTVVEHLDELRRRLIISLAAFIALSIVAFVFYDPIFEFLRRPLCSLEPAQLGDRGCRLGQFAILEGFQVRLKLTALVGLALASPVWLYQLWAFIVPGLTDRERKYAFPFVATSVLLFAGGATFAYLVMPTSLRVLIDLGGESLEPFFRADSYVNFIGLMLIVFGITFEVPLVLLFLGLAGVISAEFLRRHRRTAIVAIVALAAIVTPSQDPYTMLVMAIPLYALYELTIVLLRFLTRRRKPAG